jgi:UDP-N-acetylmuramoylalanine--D-glutamate ligase
MARNTLRFICFGMNRVNPETFSTRDDSVSGYPWLTWGLDNLIRADELGLLGRHNLSNVMAALGLGKAAGLPMDSMLQTARAFHGLPHRCEPIRLVNGVEYINDSKGTNVGATVAALDSLAPVNGKIVLIAGGDGKGADFSPLAEPARLHCRAVVLIGRDAAQLQKVLGKGTATHIENSLADAVARAAQLAQPGDRVLLSPACASLDMFRDYIDRGERFRTLVEAL